MPEVSPEMAEKVLSADLRNVIKKVGDGVPLSPAEREMMERYLAANAKMADLQKARSAALLRRWATGSKFSRAELKEIEAVFTASEGKTGKSGRLTAERYDHPLRIYAARIWPDKDIKSSVRKLKRWVKAGKEAADLPPFDDLPRLAAWYERHHRYDQAPAELRRFEESDDPTPAEKSASANPRGADSDDEDERLPSMTLDLDVDIATDAALRQVKALASAIYEQMEVALKNQRFTAYRSLRQEWLPLINTQRQWEKDLNKIQEDKGELLRARVINSEIVRVMTASSQSFFNGMDKLLKDHAPHLSALDRRRIVVEARDACFVHLRNTRFESAWTPEPI